MFLSTKFLSHRTRSKSDVEQKLDGSGMRTIYFYILNKGFSLKLSESDPDQQVPDEGYNG